MSYRETVAVADLRPDDLILPECYLVVGYAYGMGRYTVVPMDRNRNGLIFEWAFPDSEQEVEIIRD